MNNDVYNKALHINEMIKQNHVYKRYLSLKELIDDEYSKMEDEIKLVQQELVKLAFSNGAAFGKRKKDYYEMKDSFNNNLLISEYLDSYIEVQVLLNEIKEYLEAS
jgi:cell fate (sporulation/competence/biofilm development) regulator YlbF (YheA/YmcA/DUF963 family)